MATTKEAAGLVIVTPAMIRAGLEELRDMVYESDMRHVLAAIYMAMEYERRDATEYQPLGSGAPSE